MDKPSHFRVIDCGKEFVVENVKANDFQNYHTHLRKKRKKKNMKKGDKYSWQILIGLICNKRVPKSRYFQESAKRISRDKKYIEAINHKQAKDREKPEYRMDRNFH